MALPYVSSTQIVAASKSARGEVGVRGTPGNSRDDMLLYQKGLAKLVGLKGYSAGVFDAPTKAATKKFQLNQKWTGSDADGYPGGETIRRVAAQSKLFQVREDPAPPPASGHVASPVPGHGVNYPYGVRNSRYAAGYHTGEDHAAPTGTPVVAVRNGTIQWSNGAGGAYGNWIGLKADNGRVYVYCHLSARLVSVGQSVRAGQVIGRVGATGNVTGPHLHFEDHPAGPFVYGKVRKPSW